ncbi:MAG: hypothetical protein HQM09_24580 [Candidatus Riflebacteria bacterium]|nr:hypothetical protein [Candidatus Riflebacteria bacterium]
MVQGIPNIETMKISEIVVDSELRLRANDGSGTLLKETIEDYAKSIDKMPAVGVARSSNPNLNNRLFAGFTRLDAAELAGKKTIQVVYRDINTEKELVAAAATSNLTHGLRLQRADWLLIVKKMEDVGYVRAEIAEELKCSPSWISELLGPKQKTHTEEEREAILRNTRLSNKEAGAELGIGHSAVSRARIKLAEADAAIIASGASAQGNTGGNSDEVDEQNADDGVTTPDTDTGTATVETLEQLLPKKERSHSTKKSLPVATGKSSDQDAPVAVSALAGHTEDTIEEMVTEAIPELSSSQPTTDDDDIGEILCMTAALQQKIVALSVKLLPTTTMDVLRGALLGMDRSLDKSIVWVKKAIEAAAAPKPDSEEPVQM